MLNTETESIQDLERVAEDCMIRVNDIDQRQQITLPRMRNFYESVAGLVLRLSRCQMYEESLRARLRGKVWELNSSLGYREEGGGGGGGGDFAISNF